MINHDGVNIVIDVYTAEYICSFIQDHMENLDFDARYELSVISDYLLDALEEVEKDEQND